MKALVIGATGYVGSHVARALASRGHAVTGFARSAQSVHALRQAGYATIVASLDNLPALDALVGSFDIVVTAAKMPFEAEAPIMRAIV